MKFWPVQLAKTHSWKDNKIKLQKCKIGPGKSSFPYGEAHWVTFWQITTKLANHLNKLK